MLSLGRGEVLQGLGAVSAQGLGLSERQGELLEGSWTRMMALVLQPLDSSLPARRTVSPAVSLEEQEVWAGLVWTAGGLVGAPGPRARNLFL